MPDNRSPGELEDFVQTMIPGDDPVWPRSKQYIDDIPDTLRKFKPKKKSRAELYPGVTVPATCACVRRSGL